MDVSTLANLSVDSAFHEPGGQVTEAAGNFVEDMLILQRVVSIAVPILFALIVIVGLVGNSLVVIVVQCNPQMCSTTNLLIINLAIADLLFIILCVPFTAWDYAFTYWPFGSVWCKVVQYLIVVCAYASIYTVSRIIYVHPCLPPSIKVITRMGPETLQFMFCSLGPVIVIARWGKSN